ncbi:MAG: multidrug efflux system membrane fusion protein [Pseudohongiellaceae bacterium]
MPEIVVKNQHVVSAGILIAVVLWMVIPQSAEEPDESNTPATSSIVAVPEGVSPGENPSGFIVRAARIDQQTYGKKVRVRGRTQAFRHVEVRAEQAGRIVSEPVMRGARVSEGDLLCEIAVDDRDSNLLEAQSRQEQAVFEYSASLDLQDRGLQSDVIVAQLKAALQSSKAGVARAELALQRTKIVAPFDGVVETRIVELGDLLNAGTVCASVLDDSPMLLVGLVPEQDIGSLSVGARVAAELLTGQRITGSVRYLSRAADNVSRSYRIEIEVDSSFENLRQGITAEILVDSADIQAHLVPSSALTLDDSGLIGVKTIGANNMVEFNNVEIVGDNTSAMNPGVWVTGLSGTINLITLGQEIVFPGQQVESNFDWSR